MLINDYILEHEDLILSANSTGTVVSIWTIRRKDNPEQEFKALVYKTPYTGIHILPMDKITF